MAIDQPEDQQPGNETILRSDRDISRDISTRQHDFTATHGTSASASELRARLLQMIVANEKTRKPQTTHQQP